MPRSDGSPATITLLHGVNNTPAVWDPLRAYLAPRVCTAPNLPALQDVDAIARRIMPTDHAVVLGHSFGGYVALAMLAAAPERLDALVLVNSHAGADTDEARARRERSAAEAQDGHYTRLAASATPIAYGPDSLTDPALMARRDQEIRDYGPGRYIAHQRAAATRPDRRDLLAACTVPVLVVAAADDRVIPPTRQRDMAKAAGCDFAMLEHAGHMLPAEQPNQLAAVVTDWLTRLGPHPR